VSVPSSSSPARRPGDAADAYALDDADRRLRLCRREEVDDLLVALVAGACAVLFARLELRLARELASLAADPDAAAPFDRGRVRLFAPQLRTLADELGDPKTTVEPTSLAACRLLLTDGISSPLLNPDVPIVDPRSTLLRIDSGVHPADFPQADQRRR